MEKSKIQKKKSQIDLLLEEFDKLTTDSQKKLQLILDTVSGGTSPEEKQIQDLKASITELRAKYNNICAIARERLSDSELPPEGSAAKDFVTAVHEHRTAELAEHREKDLEILKRFVRVWSDDEFYIRKLSDHKKPSYEYIKILEYPGWKSDWSIEDEEYERILISAETFLKALDCEDLDSEEGIELLEKVCEYFSFDTAVGIMKKQYRIMEYGWF